MGNTFRGTSRAGSSTGGNATSTNAFRNAGVLHRNAIAVADKLASIGALTLTDDGATAGSTLPNSALHVLVSTGNRWGNALVGADPGTVTPTLNHSVRAAFAAVPNAEWYDFFISTSGSPLGLGRATAAQVLAGGFIINTVGTVTAGGSAPANSIDLGIVGTGLASNVNPFLSNNAYTPAVPTPIPCAGFSLAHAHVKVSVADLRILPTCVIIPFFQDQQSPNDWFAGSPQTIYLLTANGQCLEQDLYIQVDGATNIVFLIDTLTGTGATCSISVELM